MNHSEIPDAAARQLSFDLGGFTLKAQQWGSLEGRPVLALHGWLDNSASFERLAPLLDDVNLVALDMAGHGFSDHRPGLGPYNIWEDVAEVIAVADQLGWDEFTLLGHSRGAMMSFLTAGTFPERVRALTLLEGMLPPSVSASEAPEQLAQSIVEGRKPKSLRRFPDVQTMIRARMRSSWPLSLAAAATLTERGIREYEGGYCWSTDGRLMNASAFKFGQEHIEAFHARLSMPSRLWITDRGLSAQYDGFASRVEALERIEVVRMTGTHHWHMEEEASAVAAEVNQFWGTV